MDDSFLHLEFDVQKQWDFGIEVAKAYGYDFERGRQDAHDQLRAGLAHQGQMAFVQGAHGRNHADGQALSFPVTHDGAQIRHGVDDGEGRRLGHGEAVNPLA